MTKFRHSFEIDRSNKKASLVEYVDKKISQFLFMRARDKIPALSKNLNFPNDRYIHTYLLVGQIVGSL